MANSIILYRIIEQRSRMHVASSLPNPAESNQQRVQGVGSTASPVAGDEEAPNGNYDHLSRSHQQGSTLLMKIIGPVITFVDHPWKVSVASAWEKT